MLYEKLISEEKKSDLTKLGIYQVGGGAIGFIVVFWAAYKNVLSTWNVLLYLFILHFFAYSILCGILCLNNKKSALTHSLVNQFLQMIGFAMMGFGFQYTAGVYFTIGLDLTDSISFDFGAGISTFSFAFNRESERLEVDFNIVAFAIIFWINNLMKKVKEDMLVRKVSSIGDI